jgi:hypothetical protein
MNLQTLSRRAGMVAAAASLLFVVDLFLGWQRVSVEVAGVVDVEETSSGWHGWGFVAGVGALLLLAVAIGELRGAGTLTGHALVAAILAVGLLLFTCFAVFTGDASVDVATGAVAVEVDSTLWPAWAGLVLAAIAAVAALFPLVAGLSSREPTGLAPPSHA